MYRGMIMGSLVIVSDGSYKSLVAQDVCSCAFAVHCKVQGKTAHRTLVEKTDPQQMADNYRGELLGSLGAQLVIPAASQG